MAIGSFRFSKPEWIPLIKALPETGMSYTVVTITLKNGQVFKQGILIEGLLASIRDHVDIPFSEDDVAKVEATHDKWDWNKKA